MYQGMLAGAVAVVALAGASNGWAATRAVNVVIDANTWNGGFEHISLLDAPIALGAGDTIDISVEFTRPVEFGYRDGFIASGLLVGPEWQASGYYSKFSWTYQFIGASGVFPPSGAGEHADNTYAYSNNLYNGVVKPTGMGIISGFRQQITIDAMYSGFEHCPGGICWTGPVSTPTTYTHLSFRSMAASIPEPGTWAVMLIGFGAAGSVLRQRRRKINEQMAAVG